MAAKGLIMKKPYDQKLRDAAEEFKALCQKYDCAGVVLLVSPTNAEFVNHVNPSWSVLSMEGVDRIRFRSKREDWPTKEAQDAATNASVHMLTSIVEWSRQTNTAMRGVIDQLRPHMRIAWAAWGKPDSVPGDGK